MDEQVQRYKRSKDTVQNLSDVCMLAHTAVNMLSKVAFTLSGHDDQQLQGIQQGIRQPNIIYRYKMRTQI